MLLAIDTCGALGGVALGLVAEGDGIGPVDARGPWFRELAGRRYSELLLATIAELLAEAGTSLGHLEAVAVVRGPGSFTGIRIGVGAAKGLAEGLGIPVIALSRLELLAGKAAAPIAVAVLDAGRGEFFGGVYLRGVCEGEALMTAEELAVAAGGSSLLVCEESVFRALSELKPELVAPPTAIDALTAAQERFRLGAFDPVETLDANYVRRSETEMLARIAEHAALRAASTAQ
jgi:tRNA threonylcarbamoyladenosine biosynthesis protein TsaB